MASIYCRCGNRLSNVDQEETGRRTADFVPNSLLNRADELVQARLLALLGATRQGQSVAQFMGWPEPQSAADQDNQNILLSWHLFGEPTFGFSREIIQCDQCSRLLVQLGRTNHYTTFVPEDPAKARHILSADDWQQPTEPDEPGAE